MSSAATRQPGDFVPHFSVTTIDGGTFEYSSIWQRRNLLMVVAPDEHTTGSAGIVNAIDELTRGGELSETVVVITRSPIAGLSSPAVLIADRWGEIIHVAPLRESDAMPTAADLREWLEYVARRCPECEGEVK